MISYLIALGYMVGFAGVFAFSRWVRNKTPNHPELSRKVTHIAAGIGATAFPWIFDDIGPVLLITLTFFVLMVVLQFRGKLASVFKVGRQSIGAIVFPLVILGLYLVGKDQGAFYLVSVLVLTFSDGFAALVGKNYGKIPFNIDGDMKTVEGSLTFALIGFLCIQIPLLLLTNIEPARVLLLALVIAMMVTAFEMVSLGGSDNIFVPFGTFFLLSRMSQYPLEMNFFTLWQFLGSILLVILIFWGIPAVRKSWIILFALGNIAAIGLSDSNWYGGGWNLALILVELGLSIFLRYLTWKKRLHHMTLDWKTALKIILPPGLILFALAFLGYHEKLYLPYLSYFGSLGAYIFLWYLHGYHPLTLSHRLFYGPLVSLVSYGLFVFPFFFFPPGIPLDAKNIILMVILIVLTSLGIFILPHHSGSWQKPVRKRHVILSIAGMLVAVIYSLPQGIFLW